MRRFGLALALPALLGACAAGGGGLAALDSAALLNRLPAQLGPFAAQGPASSQALSGSRRYQVTGAIAVVTLGRPAQGPEVPDGPDAAETRVLLEQLTTTMAGGGSAASPPFGPWRRENDLRVQNEDGPPLRCSVLRRPRPDSAQVQYTCVTGLQGRYLSAAVRVNHDTASAVVAQTLAANFTGVLARMLATGNGLAAPLPTPSAPALPKPNFGRAPATEADDAVPDQ